MWSGACWDLVLGVFDRKIDDRKIGFCERDGLRRDDAIVVLEGGSGVEVVGG